MGINASFWLAEDSPVGELLRALACDIFSFFSFVHDIPVDLLLYAGSRRRSGGEQLPDVFGGPCAAGATGVGGAFEV